MSSDTFSNDSPRLDFLHGVRGLAALAIVLFHLTLNTGPESAGPIIRMVSVPLLHGYVAVPVFLVLSGFLLAMPVVTNGLALRGGIRGFIWRRSLRVLPPYYAAYLLDLLFFAAAYLLASLLRGDPGPVANYQLEIGYRWPSVVAHLLLVHNMDVEWGSGMDAILWSIACEWQIYLLYAIVLVPIWRWGGLWAMLAVCTVLAAVITEAVARGWCVYFLPWMIPVFGLGAAGASVAFGTSQRAAALRGWPWGAVTAASLVTLIAGIAVLDASVPGETLMPYYNSSFRVRWIYDMLAGIATVSLIIWLAGCHAGGDRKGRLASRLRGLLEVNCLQGLGRFSYSLYLTHGIVLVALARVTRPLWQHRSLHWAVMMTGGLVLSLALAYAFHLCFERRFMAGGTWRTLWPRVAAPTGEAARVAGAHSRACGD